MIQNALEQIGLSKNECTIYLSLLDIGNGTASEIAKHSKLHRSNVYDALQKLISDGLVTYCQKDKTKYYEPTNPKNLINILKQKEILVTSVIPELLVKYTYSRSKSEIEVHEGMVAFRNILLEQLEKTKKIYVMGVPKIAVELLTPSFLEKFHAERAKNKIDFYHLLNKDFSPERTKYLKTLPYTYAKSLPESYNSLVGVFVFDEEILLTLWIKPIINIQIKNKEIADAYREFFKMLWEKVK